MLKYLIDAFKEDLKVLGEFLVHIGVISGIFGGIAGVAYGICLRLSVPSDWLALATILTSAILMLALGYVVTLIRKARDRYETDAAVARHLAETAEFEAAYQKCMDDHGQ